jgi:hypothetical protein
VQGAARMRFQMREFVESNALYPDDEATSFILSKIPECYTTLKALTKF